MITKAFVRRAVAFTILALVLSAGVGSSVRAHDPIFITEDQTTPDTGPYMPDGTISWALYGSVLGAGDTRGFEFDLRAGDDAYLSLLIPNLTPEAGLANDQLPVIELEAPDGTRQVIAPNMRETFDEGFTNTSYVKLAEHREPGQPGRYRGLVVGNAPARFSVAIGEIEMFFTETERAGDRPTTMAEITAPLTAWYTTPPGGEPAEPAGGEAEPGMQVGVADDPATPEDETAAGQAMADAAEAMEEANERAALESSATTETAAGQAMADAAEAMEEANERAALDSSATTETARSTTPEGDQVGGVAATTSTSKSANRWVAPVVLAGIVAVVGGGLVVRHRPTR